MIFEPTSKHAKVWFIIFGLVLLIVGAAYLMWSKDFASPSKQVGEVACTQEAKLCPDGSSVGRTGPNCEFAPCPGKFKKDAWKGTIDGKTGISFQYPESLPTKYISTTDWPPKVQVINQLFACTEAGLETSRAGQTTKQEINNHTYCVTKVIGGAAGSVYAQYAYAFPNNNKTVILTFSLRFVQCGNYDAAQKEACESERKSFDISDIVDQIAQSLQLGSGAVVGTTD